MTLNVVTLSVTQVPCAPLATHKIFKDKNQSDEAIKLLRIIELAQQFSAESLILITSWLLWLTADAV